MAVVPEADARSNLLSKGFQKREGKKHIFFDFYIDGQDAGISTHFSRGSKTTDIDAGLMRLMVPQLRLQRSRQVYALLNCTMSGEEYLSQLRNTGQLQPPRRI